MIWYARNIVVATFIIIIIIIIITLFLGRGSSFSGVSIRCLLRSEAAASRLGYLSAAVTALLICTERTYR
jgi:hypothetical protein